MPTLGLFFYVGVCSTCDRMCWSEGCRPAGAWLSLALSRASCDCMPGLTMIVLVRSKTR
jgi:hypothetical protein